MQVKQKVLVHTMAINVAIKHCRLVRISQKYRRYACMQNVNT